MPEKAPGGSVAQYQLVCAAVLIAPVVYVGVAYALQFSGAMPENGLSDVAPEDVTILSLALVGGGILSSLSSIVFRKILRQRQSADSPEARFKSVLVSMAISESGAVMGLVLMLLTGNFLYGTLLCGLSFAVTCFHFPSRFWLENGDNPI